MIQRNVIKIASALALLAVSACGDDDEPQDKDQGDASVMDGGRSDAGDAAADTGRPDATIRNDGGAPDAGGATDTGATDAGATDAGAMDASTDASTPSNLDAGLSDAGDAALAEASAPDAAPDASLPALAAWYAFNENTGATTEDSTDNFSNANLQNGVTWVPGKQGSAIDLAGGAGIGNNQFVTLPTTLLADCDDVTIALWMRLGSVTNWSRLLDIDGFLNGFIFFTPAEDVGGQPHLLFNIFRPGAPGGNDQRVSAAYPPNTTLVNTWHHVAFTLSNGTGRLYFDGVQIGMNAMTSKPSDVMINTANGSPAFAWLGKSKFNDPYLDATLDDLRVSCTAYTAQQIAALAQ